MDLLKLSDKIIKNKFFKDSFWAVFGNGFGNGLLLLAGILIARFLGKDIYGEYGVVKSTMFYIASFATFGLGFTSTKFISEYIEKEKKYIKSLVRDSSLITLVFSGLIAILLISFSGILADYVEEPSLKIAFQALAGIIVCKAITTTQIGILAGFKDFKSTGRNGILSGIFMLVICVPLTYYFGLRGALISLFLSQAFNAIINLYSIKLLLNGLQYQEPRDFKKELISYSFPVALQECSFTICNWAAVLFLTKFSSPGELGLYTASAQWNAIIAMIPNLLTNVILSYLAGSLSNKDQHKQFFKKIIVITLFCSVIPFTIVYICADIISHLYGSSFDGMSNVIRVLSMVTIFEALASVFKSELMAIGKTWILFVSRFIKDAILVISFYIVLNIVKGVHGAIWFSYISVITTALFLLTIFIIYKYLIIHNKA